MPIVNSIAYKEYLSYGWRLLLKTYVKFLYTVGVVSQVRNDYAEISYLKQIDKVGAQWVFPEDTEIQTTYFDQIMASGFKVKYIVCHYNLFCYP